MLIADQVSIGFVKNVDLCFWKQSSEPVRIEKTNKLRAESSACVEAEVEQS